MPAHRDPSTLSNYEAWITKHTTANLEIDFASESLRGNVVLELESQTDSGSKEIILDSSHVQINGVKVNSETATFDLKPRSEPLGAPLHVSVPNGAAKGEVVKVEIDIQTTKQCTALQWLSPAQTSNKKAPFVFSQCQAIHARSIFPCQDTPDVKSTYTFHLTSPYTVVAGGVQTGEPAEQAGSKVYTFEQKVPIPSYLFALASGDLAFAPIGRISKVATGPNELEAARWEFAGDIDKFLDAAEKIVFPYRWGEYNVLSLPPSFPYGGMENPVYTFATPTLISGDKQNIDVIAHELAHSWSGNLVSTCSWEHFWLNEGWTIYLERRIQAAVHGDDYFDFSAVIGWKALQESVKMFEEKGEERFTKLCIDHTGIDPDDAFSTVPYEKGFNLVWELDRLVGRKSFDGFIHHYFNKWAYLSLDSAEFRTTFEEYFSAERFPDLQDKVASFPWEERFTTTGMPAKPEFNTVLVDECYALAEKWKSADFAAQAKPEDVASWSSNMKLVFLNAVGDFPEPLTAEQSQKLGQVYGFTTSQNAELKSAYFQVALPAKDTSAYQGAADLVSTVGRMKFVRPNYRALFKVAPELAVSTFKKHRDFYHPICRSQVEKDLGLVEPKSAAT